MPTKLTKRTIDGLLPRPARYEVYDSELPGFVVRVTPDGVKTFGLLYRAGTGRSAPKRRFTIGRYGSLTVDEARLAARRALADITQGGDPAADRASEKGERTLDVVGAEYLDDIKARLKPSTAKGYTALWNRLVSTTLGSRRVVDVSEADISKLHHSLRETPYVANRVLALLGSFFAYAERRKIRPRHTNPAHEVKPYKEESRERYLTPVETGQLGDALALAETVGVPPAENCRPRSRRVTGTTAKHRPKSADNLRPANPVAIAAIRFLLLTGWREGEALTLRWDKVDFERKLVHLPDTKTGKGTRTIGAPAFLLLSELPRVQGCPYVFPGKNAGSHVVEIKRVWYAVRQAAGLGDVRLHDLRHSYASVGAELGNSLLMIGKLLGHRELSTTAKYAHLADDPLRNAADKTSEQIAGRLAAGGRPKIAIAPEKQSA